jgi:hypothetical protein
MPWKTWGQGVADGRLTVPVTHAFGRALRGGRFAHLIEMLGKCTSGQMAISGEILPPRRINGKFAPGVSGNPGGVSEVRREMQELARLHSVEAIETAVRIMRTGKSETNRLMAVSMILDRAWGKPRQSVEIEQQGQTLEQMLKAIWYAHHAEQTQERAEGDQAG